MNKLFVLPLFLGAIALSSCSGFSITVADAQTRLDNVVSLATANGKYIGGKYLTRQSTRSNIQYDTEAAVVETHKVVSTYYFDINNNYFRFDTTKTDVVTKYEDQEETKVVETDYYLYVLNNQIINTIITTVNGVAADKVIYVEDVSTSSMTAFRTVVDNFYNEYIDVFEASIGIVASGIAGGDSRVSSGAVELNSFGPKSLTFFSKDVVANSNVYVAFKYNQLVDLELFNRETHELITERFNYGSVYLDYMQ